MEKLIDNAFKFSESGIPVEITAYVDPYYILFSRPYPSIISTAG
jgi:hypothetical protein